MRVRISNANRHKRQHETLWKHRHTNRATSSEKIEVKIVAQATIIMAMLHLLLDSMFNRNLHQAKTKTAAKIAKIITFSEQIYNKKSKHAFV